MCNIWTTNLSIFPPSKTDLHSLTLSKKMMQQGELLEATWPYNTGNFSFDGVELYGLDMCNNFGSLDFSPSFLSATPDYSSEISSPDQYLSSGPSDSSHNCLEFRYHLPKLEESQTIASSGKGVIIDEVSCLSDLMELENSYYSHEVLSNKDYSFEVPSAQLPICFPKEDIETDIQLSICYLIRAYGEAIENGQVDLVHAIVTRFEEKADPTGETFQRLVYYFVQSLEKHMDYLRQESFKIYKPAFLALYQIFPYGRFAHFLANSEILKAMPQDAEMVIVDFDIGEGLQWPSLFEFLGRKKHRCLVKLISVRWDEDNNNASPCLWKFEDTKRQLYEHARCCNLILQIEEMSMEELAKETKTKRSQWTAFNCMTNLPHMGRSRSTKRIIDFLKIARESINCDGGTNSGIITFGNGLMEERKNDCRGFGSFLEARMVHLHALLESMDLHFPFQLIEARLAMECLFVAPYISSFACLQNWEEISFGTDGFSMLGLEGKRLSKDSIAEGKELLGERGMSEYWMRNEGENGNEIVLGYKGNTLVKVSCWN